MRAAVFFAAHVLLHAQAAFIDCGQNNFCLQKPDSQWHIYKKSAQILSSLTELSHKMNVYISENEKNLEIIRHREILCDDDTFTGFLLEAEDENTTMACIWTGDGAKSSCSPVPARLGQRAFNFLPKQEWRAKLLKFRKSIGCSEEDVNRAGNTTELLICTKRCTMGGYGYFSVCILLISFNYAFLKMCGVRIT